MGIPKKRIPTPKRGPNGVLYDELHKAWRAGIVADFRYHGGTEWTVNEQTVGTRAGAELLLNKALAEAGIVSLAWGPQWLGHRDVIVRTATTRNAGSAFTELLDRIIAEAGDVLVTLRSLQEVAA